MRSIVHLSDLHFGRTEPTILPALAAAITSAKPDVVVVSGDLTQRARVKQFDEARRFLQSLPKPQIVVPGNHDIPLYNPVARWLRPLDNFRNYICADLEPFYSDTEIAVAGINTARSWSFKGGRINREQVVRGCARLNRLPDSVMRLVVTHHPFVLPGIVGRATMAIRGLTDCKVDVVFSGHMHVSHATSSVAQYGHSHRAALLIQAGTATSSRRRDEANSYNIVRLEKANVTVECLAWNQSLNSFALVSKEHFRLESNGWVHSPTD